MFINQELNLYEKYGDTLFNFSIVVAKYLDEDQVYNIKEHNINVKGRELMNYSDKLFCDIAFSDAVRIDARAIFKKYNLSYVFMRKNNNSY